MAKGIETMQSCGDLCCSRGFKIDWMEVGQIPAYGRIEIDAFLLD